MNLKAKLLALVFALLLLACACFAGFDTFAFAFAIGDGDGHLGVTSGILLIGTLAGGVGLVVAAFGSWSERRAINLIALVSVLFVLPATVLYGWGSVHAFWYNTKLGLHYGFWPWTSAILPPLICLLAAGLSFVRFRHVR